MTPLEEAADKFQAAKKAAVEAARAVKAHEELKEELDAAHKAASDAFNEAWIVLARVAEGR